MGTVEEELWEKIVSKHLAVKLEEGLVKAEQQALALALQEWTASCITASLKSILENQANELLPYIEKDDWKIFYQGRSFLGAVRWQEVDVWMANNEAGLILAVDPKHFQSQSSLNKNWKNGHNDLIAFATNIHERFPMCAVGGVISFPERAATTTILKQMNSICSRSIPRERALNAYGKFEGFGLAIYNDKRDLVWHSLLDDSLKPVNAFKVLLTTFRTSFTKIMVTTSFSKRSLKIE